MKLKQRLLSDVQTVKTLEKGRKWQFIWDYYKVPIITVACGFILVALTLLTNLGRGDIVMYAVLINADPEGDSNSFVQTMENSGTDMNGKTVDVAANYSLRYNSTDLSDGDTIQVLAALFGIGDLDLFVADEPVFTSYVNQEAFVDLSLFIDREYLDSHDLYTYEGEGGREIVAGIWLREGSPLHKAGYYYGDVVIGIAAGAQNLDPAVEYMKQLVIDY